MFAAVVHCQINKEYQFIIINNKIIIKIFIFVIPKPFALFCSSFWFDSGSVCSKCTVRQATKAAHHLVSVKLNLFLLIPTEIVANRRGKRSFLPTSTFNANI